MSAKRRPFAVIDCETDPFKPGRVPAPFVWGFYTRDEKGAVEYAQFFDFAGLLEYIGDRRLVVYAHNGGRFDYMFVSDYLEPLSEVLLINGRLSQFKIGNIEFRDSWNILPIKLGDYQKDEIDYSIFEVEEREKPENWTTICDYLYHDCEYLYDLIEQFTNRFGRHLTQAGCAMKTWAKMSSNEPPRGTKAWHDKFKRFYFGGRVECFTHGVGKLGFEVYDINSAYPYAMLHSHPSGFTAMPTTNLHERGLYRFMARNYGALPIRGNGLEFPRDGLWREYCATGWEVIAAMETGGAEIGELIEGYEFAECVDFDGYVRHWYDQRQTAKTNGDKAGDIFAKLLMNSLYGKFGASPEGYAKNMICEPSFAREIIKSDARYRDAGVFGKWAMLERGLDDEEMRFYNVITAASITGFVRAFLWRSICKAGIENVLYCDTDSLATIKSPGNEGKALGQWKNEGAFSEYAIAGKKLYAFKHSTPIHKDGEIITHKIASKGVKLTAKEIYQIARGDTVTYQSDVPRFSPKRETKFIDRKVQKTIAKKI